MISEEKEIVDSNFEQQMAEQQMAGGPEADVLWWDAQFYYVRCPHCEGIHRHSMNWNRSKLRVPHCENSEKYICHFPINDQGKVAYEIDKKRARYVNICTSCDTDPDEINSLSHEFESVVTIGKEAQSGAKDPDIHHDSQEMVTIDLENGIEPFEQKRILFAISNCVTGRTEAVREYLDSSVEAHIFLNGRDSGGNTTLINAAAEESLSMVSMLLKRGAKVNVVNQNGRSALMEAALWGRLDSVKLLLEYGADKSLRDNEKWSAVDLARPTQKNRRERYVRAGGEISPGPINREPVRLENTFKRDNDRQGIVRFLGGEDRKSRTVYGSPLTLPQYENYSFRRSQMKNSIVLQGPIASYPITTPTKTVARLERGGKFPSIAAMSGWSHDPCQPVRISGRQWTEEVFYISHLVGHTLSWNDQFDRDRPGQYYACHAEKQLIAYFIDRHVFLERDAIPDLELEENIGSVRSQHAEFILFSAGGQELSSLRREHKDLETERFNAEDALFGEKKDEVEIQALNSKFESIQKQILQLSKDPEIQKITALESRLEALNQQRARHKALMDLSFAIPPVSLTEAVILISSPICEDCKEFKSKINQFFGLSMQLFAAC